MSFLQKNRLHKQLAQMDEDRLESYAEQLFAAFGSKRDILDLLIEHSNEQQLGEMSAIMPISNKHIQSDSQLNTIPADCIPKYIHPMRPSIKEVSLFINTLDHNNSIGRYIFSIK